MATVDPRGSGAPRPSGVRCFGPFRLDLDAGRLEGPDGVVKLPPKVWTLLVTLVESPGRLLTKDELLEIVWSDTNVEEGSVNRAVSTLRKALSDLDEVPRFVETVPRRGYRFIAAVSEAVAEAPLERSAPEVKAPVDVVATTDPDPEPGPLVAVLPDPPPAPHRGPSRGRWLLFGSVLAIAGVVLVVVVSFKRFSTVPPATLAVLPAVALDGAAYGESLGLSIADRVIGQVGSAIHVRPVTTVTPYATRDRDPLAAGRALEVDAVLDTSLRKNEAGGVDVSATLFRVSDGKRLWRYADTYSGEAQLAERLAMGVRIALAAAVGSGEPIPPRYSRDPEAYALYLEARSLEERQQEGTTRVAETKLRSALELDPSFALARVALAEVLLRSSHALGLYEEAEAQAQRALDIDPTLGEAWAAGGLTKALHRWDFRGAEADLRKAVALSPGDATCRKALGHVLRLTGRFEAASSELEHAQAIHPLSADIAFELAELAFARRDWVTTERCHRLAQGRGHGQAGSRLLGLLLMQRRFRDVEKAAGSTSQPTGFEPVPVDEAGLKAFARELARPEAHPQLGAFEKAAWLAHLDQSKEALDFLERAVLSHDLGVVSARVDPRLTSLREDRRYGAVLKTIGLEGPF